MSQDRIELLVPVNMVVNEPFGFIQRGEFIDLLSDAQFLKKDSVPQLD